MLKATCLHSFQAGLIAVEDFSFFDVRDENTEEFQKILAEQKPHWTPGRRMAILLPTAKRDHFNFIYNIV